MGESRIYSHGFWMNHDVDVIPVYSFGGVNEPDPDWRTTDASGHVHRWPTPGTDEHKTFEWETTDTWFDEFGDEYTDGRYRCVRCGATVDMTRAYTYTYPSAPSYIAGLGRYTFGWEVRDERNVSTYQAEWCGQDRSRLDPLFAHLRTEKSAPIGELNALVESGEMLVTSVTTTSVPIWRHAVETIDTLRAAA